MKSYLVLIGFTLVAFASSALVAPPQDDVIDLTYPFDETSETFPINPRFKLTIKHRGPWDEEVTGVDWLENNDFAMAEHTGSHMDAPAHFTKGGNRIHQIPIHTLIGPGVRIDVTEKTKDNPDYGITIKDVTDWEDKYYRLPDRAIIMFYTGWGKFYKNHDKYYGNTKTLVGSKWKDAEGKSLLHWPGLSAELGDWLIKERNISGIGIDTISFDVGQTITFPVHKSILNNKRFGCENVANLDKLPPEGTMIYVMPINIRDGSGAPSRIFAVKSNGAGMVGTITLIITTLVILKMF